MEMKKMPHAKFVYGPDALTTPQVNKYFFSG